MCGLRGLNIVLPVESRNSIKILSKQIQVSTSPRTKPTQHASREVLAVLPIAFAFLKMKCFILLQLDLTEDETNEESSLTNAVWDTKNGSY